MSGLLKWEGNALMLGATKMGDVRLDTERYDVEMWRYVLGRDDVVSSAYQSKEDARQDCEAHVRRLLKKAGVGNA